MQNPPTKDEYLAKLAHDLRNSLGPIRNAVGVMRMKGMADPSLVWARDVIERQVTQLTRLVDDLLLREKTESPNAPPSSNGLHPVGAAHRILVVDDNADAAESLAMLLRLMGNEVRTAHDGAQARLAAAKEYRPGVVFMDIGLPGMDGYKVAEQLRSLPLPGGAAIIALTGYGGDNHHRRSEENGFYAHLVKPVDPDALRMLLASIHRAPASM